MGEDFPAISLIWSGNLLGVDGDDDALIAELVGGFGNKIRIVDRGGVDRDLVGAGQKQFADILDCAHAAADGQRHEAVFGGLGHDIENRLAVVRGGGDVEKAEFVGAGGIIGLGGLHGIAGIDQINEIDALDDAAVLDIQAGDDTGFQSHERSSARILPSTVSVPLRTPSASAGSMRPS
jgi:hypothetical protein